jgi:hypothetical protein
VAEVGGIPTAWVVPNDEHDVISVARARAMLDFRCPREEVRLDRVAKLNVGTVRFFQDQVIYIAHACGHEARYACLFSTDRMWCVREPLDERPPARPSGEPR